MKLLKKYETSLNYQLITINMKHLIEEPVVTISDDKKILTLHNCITMKGNMVINKEQAALLYIELHKFITNDEK